MFNKSTFFLTIMAFGAMHSTQSVPRWDWQSKDMDSMSFPSNFKFGTTMLDFEMNGNAVNSTFFTHELYRKKDGSLFTYERSGLGVDHQNRYKEDAQLIADAALSINCIVLDWARIEPTQGDFDAQALQRLADECDEYNVRGIEPMIVLKGYSDPIWFLQLGGFEKEANIALFEKYCLKVFEVLQGKVYKFITFYAPDAYAMLGYWNNTHPPFKRNMQLAVDVLTNQLKAHVRVYNRLKAADKEKKIQVGIVKHVLQLEPVYPWDKLRCFMANMLTNTLFYNFFSTGKLDISIPIIPSTMGGVKKHYRNPSAPRSIDFIGINYHCHYRMKNGVKKPFKNEPKTDCEGITVYPEGLYYAIEEVSNKMARKLNIPIWITSNPIATTDDNLRMLHNERNLYAVSEAIKHGHNVQGYCYYSLLDGFMWGGYDIKFGLYSVDRTTMERTLKPGAARFIEIAKKHNNAHA